MGTCHSVTLSVVNEHDSGLIPRYQERHFPPCPVATCSVARVMPDDGSTSFPRVCVT